MSLQDILKLPTAERLHVVEQIWDSINKEDMAIPESQRQELDRRLNLDKNNKIEWLSINEFKDRLGHHS